MRRDEETASYLEAAIVIEARFGEPGGRELDLWPHRAGVELVAVGADQAEAARAAYRRYGKGRHRAGLNFGDCFAYALAMINGQPLICLTQLHQPGGRALVKFHHVGARAQEVAE